MTDARDGSGQGGAHAGIGMYNAQDREHDRLTRGLGLIEFTRTLELLGLLLPPGPAVLADIGAGTGVYARELLTAGYEVHALDATPGHVARLRVDPTLERLSSVTLGDARALPYPDASVDAALLLGPLYHLTDPRDRARALAEAARVLRPGGVLLAAAITRAADIAGDFVRGGAELDEAYARPIREHTYRTGVHRNPEGQRGHFTDAYCHHPHELAGELSGAGFRDVSVYAVEGVAALLRDPDGAMRDPQRREGILRALRLTERDPALLGVSPHLLGAGVRAG
ncbi:class I SAM-dependent methyltransferase [Deinococcus radiotolerans]|uniref:Methyltransferase type 11 domain-containing protein n=1 Tax=Deinococcus radiotolerans TaxID=1309407 RepID=A0ABQ2FPT8_9DEIO|nr:class I SAM-dependent methyltransferase [Deinococcus radiotolerans]GGL14843.1 hypothetical protein GCM10010844_37100 [Deinococcus radiotolerans]